jgi:predicted ATPase
MHDDDDPMGPQPVTLADQLVARATTIADRTERAMLAFEERRQHGAQHVIKTPFHTLDAALRGGLWPGVYALTGAPGSGKTQLSAQIAANAAIAGTPTVHVAFGLAENEVMARLLGSLARPLVPWSDVLLGEVDGRRWERVEEAAGRLRDLPMHVEATSLMRFSPANVEDLCAEVKTSSSRRMLIVLDGVPLASPDDEARARAQKLLQGARYAAETHGAALLLTVPSHHAALSPKVVPTAPETASFGELVASLGDEVAAADAIFALLRRPGGPGAAWLALPKVAFAPPSSVELYFSGTMFTEPQR